MSLPLLVLAARAHAYEDQLTLGVGLGAAYASLAEHAHLGPALTLDASIGLTESWSIRSWLGASIHPGDRALQQGAIGAEAFYLVDLLAVVPYVGAGVDLLGTWGLGDGTRVNFGGHPVVGLDWLVTRELLLGINGRAVFIVTDWSRQPVYLTVALTASWVIDL